MWENLIMYIFDFSLIVQSLLIGLWVHICFWLAYNPKDLSPKHFIVFKDTQGRLIFKSVLIFTFILLNIQRRFLFSLEY
jgi:hypothetical protein